MYIEMYNIIINNDNDDAMLSKPYILIEMVSHDQNGFILRSWLFSTVACASQRKRDGLSLEFLSNWLATFPFGCCFFARNKKSIIQNNQLQWFVRIYRIFNGRKFCHPCVRNIFKKFIKGQWVVEFVPKIGFSFDDFLIQLVSFLRNWTDGAKSDFMFPSNDLVDAVRWTDKATTNGWRVITALRQFVLDSLTAAQTPT